MPNEVWDVASLAMYGGWFEVSMFGPTPGHYGPAYNVKHHKFLSTLLQPITEYDLTSAYPHAMANLPCLRHSTWEHRPPRPGEYALQLAQARYTRPVNTSSLPHKPDWRTDDTFPMFMGLPHRDVKGRVSRPLHTIGWYWNFELGQARHQDIAVTDSWTWVRGRCDCNMWEFIPELFALRQKQVKKGKTG